MAKNLTTAGVLIAAVVATAFVGHSVYMLDPSARRNDLDGKTRNSPPGQRVESRLSEVEKSLIVINRRLDELTEENREISDRVERRLSKEIREKNQELYALEQQLLEVSQSSQQLLQAARQLTGPVIDGRRQTTRSSEVRAPEAVSEGEDASSKSSETPTRVAVSHNSRVSLSDGDNDASPSPQGNPAPDREGRNQWVINLIAVANRAKAEQLQQTFGGKGIDAYIIEIPATKTRQQLFGLRMDGFASEEEARSAAPAVKRKLGLDEVLISSK
jgi:cell division septation protein DedD